MDDRELETGYRNAWILTAIAAVFAAAFFAFVVRTNSPGTAPTWDMGGTPFVPASSTTADGYYKEVFFRCGLEVGVSKR